MATLITEVAAELLTLESVKAYLRVTHSLEDGILTDLIKAARKLIQSKTGYAIGSQVHREIRFIRGEPITRLTSPLRPINSLVVTIDGTTCDISEAIVEDDLAIVHLAAPLYGDKLAVDWTVGTTALGLTETDIVDAWKSLVGFMYENRGADDQVAMPAAIAQVLGRYRVYQV